MGWEGKCQGVQVGFEFVSKGCFSVSVEIKLIRSRPPRARDHDRGAQPKNFQSSTANASHAAQGRGIPVNLGIDVVVWILEFSSHQHQPAT